MLTSEEYVEGGGSKCPNCGANGVYATDDLPWNEGPENVILCQVITCENCSSEWIERYVLCGFDNFHKMGE